MILFNKIYISFRNMNYIIYIIKIQIFNWNKINIKLDLKYYKFIIKMLKYHK